MVRSKDKRGARPRNGERHLPERGQGGKRETERYSTAKRAPPFQRVALASGRRASVCALGPWTSNEGIHIHRRCGLETPSYAPWRAPAVFRSDNDRDRLQSLSKSLVQTPLAFTHGSFARGRVAKEVGRGSVPRNRPSAAPPQLNCAGRPKVNANCSREETVRPKASPASARSRARLPATVGPVALPGGARAVNSLGAKGGGRASNTKHNWRSPYLGTDPAKHKRRATEAPARGLRTIPQSDTATTSYSHGLIVGAEGAAGGAEPDAERLKVGKIPGVSATATAPRVELDDAGRRQTCSNICLRARKRAGNWNASPRPDSGAPSKSGRSATPR